MFFKIGVLKDFANFTGKHQCWSRFLIKLTERTPTLKEDSNTCVFLWRLRSFWEHLVVKNFRWLLDNGLNVSIVETCALYLVLLRWIKNLAEIELFGVCRLLKNWSQLWRYKQDFKVRISHGKTSVKPSQNKRSRVKCSIFLAKRGYFRELSWFLTVLTQRSGSFLGSCRNKFRQHEKRLCHLRTFFEQTLFLTLF